VKGIPVSILQIVIRKIASMVFAAWQQLHATLEDSKLRTFVRELLAKNHRNVNQLFALAELAAGTLTALQARYHL